MRLYYEEGKTRAEVTALPGIRHLHEVKEWGQKLVMLNTCGIYEKNRKFRWVSEKPFHLQVTFLLGSEHDSTNLTWIVESEETGIVQMAEPLLVKQTDEMMRKSLMRLEAYLKDKKL